MLFFWHLYTALSLWYSPPNYKSAIPIIPNPKYPRTIHHFTYTIRLAIVFKASIIERPLLLGDHIHQNMVRKSKCRLWISSTERRLKWILATFREQGFDSILVSNFSLIYMRVWDRTQLGCGTTRVNPYHLQPSWIYTIINFKLIFSIL